MTRICIARKKDGTWCTHKAKYGHHCGYHHPDGYHKSPKVQHINEYNNKSEVERILQTLINLHNDLMIRIDVIANDVNCNSHKLNDLRRTLFPILGPLRVAVNTASYFPIVGRFVA